MGLNDGQRMCGAAWQRPPSLWAVATAGPTAGEGKNESRAA